MNVLRAVMELGQQVAFQEPGLALSDETVAREARFAALVERHSRFVFRVAYAVLRNPDNSEDVVQETFLKLYRSGGWEQMRDERAFLARAAWRIAIRRRRGSREQPPDADLPSSGASPEETAIGMDWTAAVHRLVDALPEELRQPLALSAVEELSSGEIAAVLGIAEGTVRSKERYANQNNTDECNSDRGARSGCRLLPE